LELLDSNRDHLWILLNDLAFGLAHREYYCHGAASLVLRIMRKSEAVE
jgi:hypothetical protein